MKKNKAMRAAGVLLIATMLTTCMTAGTFAKYTTTDSAADSARVAKFGVTVSANGSLFGNAYKATTDDTPVFVVDNPDAATVTVKTTGEKVVAPGTKNTAGLGLAVKGTPEVDVKFTGTITTESVYLKTGTYAVMVEKPAGAVTAANFTTIKAAETLYTRTGTSFAPLANDATFSGQTVYYVKQNDVTTTAEYYPVVYTLSTHSTTNTTASDSAKAVGQALADKLKATGKTINPVADTNNAAKNTFTVAAADGKTVKALESVETQLALGGNTITWTWAIENENMNPADTILGDLQAWTDASNYYVVKPDTETAGNYTTLTAGRDYNLNTGIDFTITAEQVD